MLQLDVVMLASVCRLAGLDVAVVLACTARAACSRNVKVGIINPNAPRVCQLVSTTMTSTAVHQGIHFGIRVSKMEESVTEQAALA